MKYLIQHFLAPSFENRATQVAIEQAGATWSYADVDSLANQFRDVYGRLGLRPGDRVAILSRVRPEAIAAMLGALRAGIVYVPLNIHAPVAWMGAILRQSDIHMVVVDPKFEDKAAGLLAYGVTDRILLDTRAGPVENGLHTLAVVAAASTEPGPQVPLLADDICYILYTSGSTGDPKGIMITHRNAFTFIEWMRLHFRVDENDRILSRAPLQFDLSVFDIFSSMAAGARLVLAGLDAEDTPQAAVDLMRDKKVTIVYTVPSAYIGMLVKGHLDRGVPSLRLLLYAGEPFPTPYLRRVMECLPGTVVANIYGPTETNIVTCYELHAPPADDSPIPIGRTVHDTEAYIVDDRLQPVAPGDIGEILIRGGTVFAGYFNDPDLTARKLVQSPFHSYPTLCCRTGDYGRLLPDGNIAYHGRMDNMIKTRGYRVELGEVEAAISASDGVGELAVVARPHERYGNTLHEFVALNTEALSAADLRSQVSQRVPSYMVPIEFIVLPELPKTSTGKVDRVGLAAMLQQRN